MKLPEAWADQRMVIRTVTVPIRELAMEYGDVALIRVYLKKKVKRKKK